MSLSHLMVGCTTYVDVSEMDVAAVSDAPATTPACVLVTIGAAADSAAISAIVATSFKVGC